jgi:signal transduction histidine kinase
VARIRAGRIEMKPAEGDLLALSRTLVEELRGPGGAGRIELTHAGSTTGRFDADRLGAAISNLVGNALQHGAGSTVRVHVDGTQPESLRVQVANQGVIPAETLAKLFEPFHSSGPSSSNHGGLGLGLYIVNEFVKAHGGAVSARSTREDGTVIELGLPRGKPVAA